MAAALLTLFSGQGALRAQIAAIDARVGSVTGRVQVSNGQNRFDLQRGYLLSPGDVIDTRGGGRALIDLSDGSSVLVEPGSLITIKDYRAAGSLRELFDIAIGKVRVRINHFLGRPNPYRMNSPTASIAVRGTEFIIEVAPSGETRVIVIEGAVEVESLLIPGHKVLLEAGRAGVVEPGREARPFAANSRENENNEHGKLAEVGTERRNDRSRRESEDGERLTGQGLPANTGVPRTVTSAYERFLAALADLGPLPFQMRFNAFPERHLDSLENPAYATEFRAAEGRLLALPVFTGNQRLESGLESSLGAFGGRQFDYLAAPQASLYVPFRDGRWVAGGNVGGFSSHNSASFAADIPDPDTEENGLDRFLLGGSASRSSLVASGALARRFGSNGRNSLGFSVHAVRGTGALRSANLDDDAEEQPAAEQFRTRSTIRQMGFGAGLSHDFDGGHKLGVVYRYGLIDSSERDTFRSTPDAPLNGLESLQARGHTASLGLRLRGPVSRRLFYGAQTSWQTTSLGETLFRNADGRSGQRDTARKYAGSLGFGYVVNRWALVAADFSGGSSRVRAARFDQSAGALLQTGTANSRFMAAHLAVQVGLGKRVFVSGSVLLLGQSNRVNSALLPGANGVVSGIIGPFLPSTAYYQMPSHSSDFGAGWKFTPNLFAQYVYSTNYGFSRPAHAIVLRWTVFPHAK